MTTTVFDGPWTGESSSPEPKTTVRYLVSAVLSTIGLLGTGGTTAATPAEAAAFQIAQQPHSTGATTSEVGIEVAAPDFAASLRGLQEMSGLTWGEVARGLGVTRRSVHLWAAGRPPSERHALRLEEFRRLVTRMSRETPRATRSALIAPTAPDGRSALTRFELGSRPTRSPISTLKVRDFVDDAGELARSPLPDVAHDGPIRPQVLRRRDGQ